MEYIIKLRQRNASKEDMLADLVSVAKKLNTTTLTKKQYQLHGKFSPDTIAQKFGSWSVALELCGLTSGKASVKPRYKNAAPDELIADIQRVAKKLGTDTLTSTEYDLHGQYNHNSMTKVFGSWKQATNAAGLRDTGYHRNISDTELMENIASVWSALGRQPYCSDIKDGLSSYGIKVYFQRYGSWNNALKRFIEYVQDDNDSKYEQSDAQPSMLNSSVAEKPVHRTKRDINLRLRFTVMKRDNFKCRVCGASPSTDQSVILHVDHIIPWAKGGETIFDNLQTLCSACNIGKSDII